MRRFLFLFFFIACYAAASAKEGVRAGPEPGWLQKAAIIQDKKPAAGDISNGYYYELWNRQINLVNQTRYTHYIEFIANESGVQSASEVSVYFSPEFQQIVFHQAFIIREGKKLSQLGAGRIKVVQEETEASNYEYTGIKRAYITLKDLRKGDRIEIAYSVIGFNPVFKNRYADEFFFSSQTPVCNYFLCILTEPGQKLFIKTFNKAPDPDELSSGSYRIYRWVNPPLKPSSSSTNIPSWFVSDPRVTVSSYENWAAVVNWGLDIFNHYEFSLPPDLLNKIKAWWKIAGQDQDLFSNLALRFVQDQVRYLGLEIGTYTHHPHDPAQVFELRFGDCKDKALLLTTILNQSHIQSFVALVNTDEGERLADAAPSANEFNHAIVAIKRASGYIFVDPTQSLQRGELINNFIPAYGYALILRPGETGLEPVEPGFLHNTTITETVDARFTDSARYSVNTIYTGGAADYARNNFSASSQKEIAESCLKYYVGQFDGIALLQPVQYEDDSLKNEVTLRELYSIPHIWRKEESGKNELNVFAKSVYEHLPDPASHRTGEPIALSFPQSIRFTFVLNMPVEFSTEIKAYHVKNASYQFDFTPKENGKTLEYQYYLKTFRDFIPPEDLVKYKEEYKEINSCLSLSFYTHDASSPAPADKVPASYPSKYNWVLIWSAFFFGLLFTGLCRHLDKQGFSPESDGDAWPLGGWTIVLGITIGLRLLLQGYVSWQQDYFSRATWMRLGDAGGNKLQGMLVTELFMALFALGSCVALMYWFLKRREIFPKMFILFTGFTLGSQLLLIILYQQNAVKLASSQNDLIVNLFRSCIYAAIWITYVLRSERVQHTFVQ